MHYYMKIYHRYQCQQKNIKTYIIWAQNDLKIITLEEMQEQ